MELHQDNLNFENLSEDYIHRVIYSGWDIQQALSALTFLLEECEFEERTNIIQLRKLRCYESNMIISLARPFVPIRGKRTLSLKSLGIFLDKKEKLLIEKIKNARNKIVAHSDVEEMHFKSTTIEPLDDINLIIPLMNFSESLHFEQDDYFRLEDLLRGLKDGMAKYLFHLTQVKPEIMEVHKIPESFGNV